MTSIQHGNPYCHPVYRNGVLYGKFEKAQYLEMLLYIVGDNVFYCYYERVAERRMWFFFIRHFGAKEVTLSKT